MVEAVKDASSLWEVERRAQDGARPGFRITELQISPSQKVPWHHHSNVQDTFYVIEGALRIFLQNPKEEVRLARGQTCSVPPRRPHLVTNAGDTSAVFLVLQGSASTISCPWRKASALADRKFDVAVRACYAATR
jgi:quercetin dioxygenase-like cupin family protein